MKMPKKTELTLNIFNDDIPTSQESAKVEDVLKFKKRMLEWNNPVEYVNNMYGSHPDDYNNEYFKVIFAK